MCWIGHLQLKIAQEDIPIFKILSSTSDGRLTSIYRYYTYTLNKEAESLIIAPHTRKDGFNLRTENYVSIIDVALHSYSSSVKLLLLNHHPMSLNTPSLCIMMEELMLDQIPLSRFNTLVKAYGVIPKGATYCKNDREEYISNKLILKHIELIQK